MPLSSSGGDESHGLLKESSTNVSGVGSTKESMPIHLTENITGVITVPVVL